MVNRLFLMIIMGLVLTTQMAYAQSEQPLLERLRESFKKEYLSIGLVLQILADAQIERSLPRRNGFSVANLRLVLSGELDKNFGYLLKANFIEFPGILDAKMYYRFSPTFTVDMGLYKAPFSKELLTPTEATDFVNRAQIVAALAPGRQIGVQLRGTISEGMHYKAGIFNGNGFGNNTNDNNNFMYVARLSMSPLRDHGSLEIGANAAHSKDDLTRIGNLLNPLIFEPILFTGDRTLWGVDVRYAGGKILLAGEYVGGDFDGSFSLLSGGPQLPGVQPSGFHVTAGYMPLQNLQLLARFDSFEADGTNDRDLIILGINYWPSQATEFQLNYSIDPDDSEFKHHRLLVNSQIAF